MRKLSALILAALLSVGALAQTVSADPNVTGIPAAGSNGFGSVTSISVTPSNGITSTLTTPTSTPTLTLGLGAITPTSVSAGTVTVTVINGTPTISNPTLVAPALGTPASGVATNLTGTAASLSVGTATFATSASSVTTNANLTGPVSSTGNTTTLTAVTGTGSTIVLATSPTLTTPTFTTPRLNTATFATIVSTYPASSNSNGLIEASDLGTNGAQLRSNGTRWLPVGGETMLKMLTASSSSINSVTAIVLQYQIPAAAVAAGDTLRFRGYITKSGTTDTCTVIVYLGTAGTTSDTQALAGVSLIAANVTVGGEWDIAIVSATSTLRVGLGTPGSGSIGTQSSNAIATPVTVSSLTSNAMWLSVGLGSSGSTNTCQLQQGSYLKWITG